MTTIAYDGKLVAVDTQVTAGGTKYAEAKHYDVVDIDGVRRIIFGAGNVTDIRAAVESIVCAETPQEGLYELLVVTPGEAPSYHCGDGCEPLRLSPGPFAAGSGHHAALGALHAGQNATQAVLTACKIDLYSGAPVETLQVRSMRWLKPRLR